MPTKAELRELARTRLKEAKVLFNSGLYDGSWYLAGYVVELALKARICRILDLDSYPDTGQISKSFKTHNLDHLLKLAGLENKLKKAWSSQRKLFANWSIVTSWNEHFRYKPVGTSKMASAQNIINSLENKTDGVFVWIKKYW